MGFADAVNGLPVEAFFIFHTGPNSRDQIHAAGHIEQAFAVNSIRIRQSGMEKHYPEVTERERRKECEAAVNTGTPQYEIVIRINTETKE